MTEERSPDEFEGLSESWEREVESRSTKERIYEVATSLTEPTAVADIAERASCSKEGARSNLEWLTEIGVVSKVAENPALYVRTEAYFEFLRIHRLTEEYTPEELEAEITAYESRDETLSNEFGVPHPEDVDLYAREEAFDDAYDRLSEWRAVRRRLTALRKAKQRTTVDEHGAVV